MSALFEIRQLVGQKKMKIPNWFGYTIVALALAALSACGTTGGSKRQELHKALLEVSEVSIPGGSNVSNEKTDKAFRKVIGRCANVLNQLENRGDKRRKRLLTFAIVGAVAGSVAAPAVIADEGSKALAAGLSGLAGATNTSQQLIGEQGYSRAELILARENIVTKLNGYVDQWLALEGVDGNKSKSVGRSKINAKIGILNGMVVACSMYPLGPTRPSDEVKQLVESVEAKEMKVEAEAEAE